MIKLVIEVVEKYKNDRKIINDLFFKKITRKIHKYIKDKSEKNIKK